MKFFAAPKPSPKRAPTAHEIARIVVQCRTSERTVRAVLLHDKQTRSPAIASAIRDAWEAIASGAAGADLSSSERAELVTLRARVVDLERVARMAAPIAWRRPGLSKAIAALGLPVGSRP